MKSKNKKNRDCTLSDSQIVDLFYLRDEKAIEVTKNKYKCLINSICFSILSDKRDCEECENSVLFRLWKTIPPEKPVSLKAYIIRMARFISLDMFRAEHRQKRIRSDMTESLDDLSDFLCDEYSIENELLQKELEKVLNDFVKSLPEKQRGVFIKRYYFSQSLLTIEKEYNMTYKQVRKMLQSICSDLKEILSKKGLV